MAVWDRRTGKPVHRAIVWQDRRTADRCELLVKEGLAEALRAETGLVIDPYFSATKLEWLLANVPGLRSLAEKGEALFGTIDTWLAWKLSSGKQLQPLEDLFGVSGEAFQGLVGFLRRVG